MKIRPLQTQRRRSAGFSLVEMMVAITVGLVLISVMTVVYVNSRSSTGRQGQLSTVQQSVRTAFEYLGFDSRMVGHLGCFTRLDTLAGSTATLAGNFRVGIEGYEHLGTGVGETYTLTSSAPADTLSDAGWAVNAAATVPTIPLAAIAGGGTNGLTPGSDVLILRGAAIGRPVRLTAAVNGAVNTVPIDTINNPNTSTCPAGGNSSAGFCAQSYGVIASCSMAQAFIVNTAGTSLTLSSTLAPTSLYAVGAAEVLPLQTIIYYVRRSSSGTTTSLYRRVLDGAQTNVALQEQELIEGVENMQIRYAVDTETEPDGIMNGEYVTATGVTNWNQVIAVRISLLLRPNASVDANLVGTSARVNGVNVTYPTTGPRFDRRVFTTTVALRNRIAYAVP